MIKNVILAIGISFLGFNSYAQKNNTLLWEITGKGIEKPSYLFGTLHMTCDATLKPKVLKALDNTNRMFLEIDMDAPDMQQKMMGNLLMTDGNKISDMLSPEDFKKLDTYLQNNFNMPLKLIDNYKPFFIQSLLYTKTLNCPMQSIEGELIRISKEQNEEISGLETIESQLAIFDKIPYDKQISDVIEMLNSIEKNNFTEMEEMMRIYQSENLNELMDLIEKSDIKTLNQYNEELVVKRNQNWIPVIIKESKEQPTFFGVGAAHLGGKNGVIKLLKKQGYKVKPIN